MRIKCITSSSIMKGVLIWGMLILTFYLFMKKDDGSLSMVQVDSFSSNIKSGRNLASINTIAKYYDSNSNSTNDSNVKQNAGELCTEKKWVDGLPVIYMVTPTYRRAEQLPELTRTAQTLTHVKNLVWIVVEDASKPSQEIIDYLAISGLTYVYLRAQMPKEFSKTKYKRKPRGVANRNAGMNWVKEHATSGVIYFGDDDNTYDLRIFEEIRYTKKVSMFPVGLVTKLGVSTPIVKNGKVIGFYDGWIAKRKFPVDMAGFAVNVKLLLEKPEVSMPYVVGYEEDGLLKRLNFQISEIEPKAENCTKIWVWHTQTNKNPAAVKKPLDKVLQDTNLNAIQKILWIGV